MSGSGPNPRTSVQRFGHEYRLAVRRGPGDIAVMDQRQTVFVNARPVVVATGAVVRDALVAFDASVADQASAGQATVTDGVGRPVGLDALLTGGAILRVVPSARAKDAADIEE